jgi:hypothetical protein
MPQNISAEDAVSKRFLMEAPQRWKEYQALLRGFELQSEYFTEFVAENRQERATDRTVLSANGTQAVEEFFPEDAKRVGFVRGNSPSYDFELRKKGGSQSELSIHDIQPLKTNVNGPAMRHALAAANIWQVYMFDFLSLCSSNELQIKDAKEIAADGRDLVQIEFEYVPASSVVNQGVLAKRSTGTVLFDPNSYWAIVGAKITVHNATGDGGERIELTQQMEKALKDIPVPVESQVRLYDSGGKLIKRSTSKYQWKEYLGDGKDFTLPGYGFPEPTFAQPSLTRLWVALTCVVLIVFCLTILVYRRWRNAEAAGWTDKAR